MTGGAKVYDMPPREPAATPDHDLYAEQVVVAALLLGEVTAPGLAEQLTPADLYDRRHKAIFEATLGLAAGGAAVDLAGVAAWLRAAGRLGEVGIPYLTSLSDVPPGSLDGPLSTIRESARVRRLEQALGYAAARLRGPQRDRAGLLAEVAELVARATAEAPRRGKSFPTRAMGDVPPTPKPVTWISERLGLAKGRPGCLVGYSGSFKSWLIYDLALAVAAPEESGLGATCWGGLPVDQHGPVVVIDMEMGEDMVEERLALLAAGRWSEPAAWGDRLTFASFPAWSLTTPGAEETLCAVLDGKTLAVIDSLVMVLGGGDENDNARVAALMQLLTRVSQKTQCAILVLHHEGKTGAEGPKAVNQRGRGASSIQGMWSCQWAVTAHEGGRLVLENGKVQRGGLRPSWSCQIADVCDDDGRKVGVRLAPVASQEGVSAAGAGEEMAGGLERAKTLALSILGAMGALPSGKLHEELKRALKEGNKNGRGVGTTTRYQAVEELCQVGRIVCQVRGNNRVYLLSTPVSTSRSGRDQAGDAGEGASDGYLPDAR